MRFSAYFLARGALGRAGLGVIEAELQPAHLQAWRKSIQSGVCSSSLRSALKTSSRASVP